MQDRRASTRTAARAARGEGQRQVLEGALLALAQGALTSAEEGLRRYLDRSPTSAEAHNALGNCLRRAGRRGEALAAHQRAAQLAPHSPKALADLGLSHLALGDCSAATRAFERALRQAPGDAQLLYNLGTTALHLGQPQRAADYLERVVQQQPDNAEALFNLGLARKRCGRPDEALPLQQRAHRLSPDNAELEWGLALTEILLGHLDEGFAHFEARRRLRGYALPGSCWSGEPTPLPLTVKAEQGLGDTLQFVRFLRAAAKRVASVTLECRPELVPLLSGADLGIDKVRSLRPHDADSGLWAPLMSLPALVGVSAEHLRAPAYLKADPALISQFKARLAFDDDPRPLIGVNFQGNPRYRADAERSIPLRILEPLLRSPSLRCVSFQKGHGHEQVQRLPQAIRPLDLGSELDNDGAAFVETAAALHALRALVTTDTALVHLAGALGIRTILMLPFDPDFRWGISDSRWYASVHVVRQEQPGAWAGVVQRVLRLLEQSTPASGKVLP